MVCNVIENCRCYSYEGEDEQWCGVRKGPDVLPCPTDCCAGGCPDYGTREPFRYILKPKPPIMENRTALFIIWLIVTIFTIYYFRSLKIKSVRRI